MLSESKEILVSYSGVKDKTFLGHLNLSFVAVIYGHD
jgi:hypothetical protein